MQLVLQALIHMWKLTLVQLILERENKAAVAKDLPRDMTLLFLLREQIFVNKARAVLSARILTALAAMAMCPVEVRLRLYFGTHQPIHTLFLLTTTIAAVIEPLRLAK
jgi:hypothetical protein